MGELQPVLPTGGFSTLTALTMATDVMAAMIAQRFNWRWNRMKVPPFYTSSWQQDYAQLSISTWPSPIGWIEGAYWVDINNTALPKPTYAIESLRGLPVTSISGNPPAKIDWLPNNQLNFGVWPGPNLIYTQPLGAVITPTNGPVNILDMRGNILILTQYGTTGAVAPQALPNASEGTTVTDGSCIWTVADPNSQGFRLIPLPPQQGVVYQVNVIGQMQAPAQFTSMQQQINPIPDDYATWFREGFKAFCYQMSPNPQMQMAFERKKENWISAMASALKQGDREQTDAGFIPDRSVMQGPGAWEIGPANPYAWSVWSGR
jgi:hypothetical protein